MLDEFLVSSTTTREERSGEEMQGDGKKGFGTNRKNNATMKKKSKTGVQGVWISARDGQRGRPGVDLKNDKGCEEEDEMIWWSWNGGKMVGFVDW
jgi:hypothetical protein